MAVWQFPLMLAPEEALRYDKGQDLKSFLGDDGWDLSDLWIGGIDVSSAKLIIEEHLGSGHINKLIENTINWGAERGNNVALDYEDEHVREIVIRMDMRVINDKFMKSVTQIAKDLHCKILIIEQHLIIEPTIEELEWYAKLSRAASEAHLYYHI